MAYIRHGTLTAVTVATVTLDDRSYSTIEVLNRDGVDEIYFIVLNASNVATDPTVGGNDCECLPAAMSALEVLTPDPPPYTVKLISSGTPDYSIRAE